MVSREGKTELFARWYGGNMVVADEGVGTGLRWWVDSGAGPVAGGGTGRGGDTIGHGHNPDAPFVTVDYAITQCVANRGDIIYVCEGHVEDSDAVLFDVDIAGITIIGLGNGVNRPEFHFNNAAATVDIGASDCKLVNLKFLPSITSVLIGIDIEADAHNTEITGCVFWEGEDGAGADEFVTTIELKAGADGTWIHHNDIRSHTAAAECTSAILLNGISDRVKIHDNLMIGNWSTAAVNDAAVCTSVYVADNHIKVKDAEPGIELSNTTTGMLVRNMIESTGVAAANAIVAQDCAWFANLVVTADGINAVPVSA